MAHRISSRDVWIVLGNTFALVVLLMVFALRPQGLFASNSVERV